MLQLRCERSTEGSLGKAATEILQALACVGCAFVHPAPLPQMASDGVRDLDGPVRGRLVPGPRDRRAALVANTPIIRRKGGGDDKHGREAVGRQISRWNRLHG